MKVAILGTNGLPARYGGFETLAHHLSKSLSKDFDVIVYCSKTKKEDRLKEFNKSKLIYFPFRANGWQSVFYDFFTIIHAMFYCQNLIILGFSGAFAFPFNFFFKKNIIFNIGGIEWKKVRGNKITSKFEIYIKKFMEKICINFSNNVIIDNLYFKNYITEKYTRTPILAEYGGDHAIKQKLDLSHLVKYPFLDKNYDLSISRAQSDMNIDIIIDAYKKTPSRNIVIISNWHISDYGKKLFDKYYNKYSNIFLQNAIFDIEILNMIRSNCSLYIHSHSLCGTAPSLVEAMYLRLAIISFDVPTNRYTTDNKAKYFSDSHSLAKILNKLNNSELKIISENMFKIAIKRYHWKRITKVYKNLLKKV